MSFLYKDEVTNHSEKPLKTVRTPNKEKTLSKILLKLSLPL